MCVRYVVVGKPKILGSQTRRQIAGVVLPANVFVVESSAYEETEKKKHRQEVLMEAGVYQAYSRVRSFLVRGALWKTDTIGS